MKNFFVRLFGLKGSWKWAKRQMFKGKIIRARSYSGSLKLKIDSIENNLLMAHYGRTEFGPNDRNQWEAATYHFNMERKTDYYVFEWSKMNW